MKHCMSKVSPTRYRDLNPTNSGASLGFTEKTNKYYYKQVTSFKVSDVLKTEKYCADTRIKEGVY